jgi:superkiller protein 3
LGNIFSDQQRWEEAEKSYREAIALAPESPDPYVAISYVLTQPIIGKDLSVRYLEAQKMARRAIELDPANPIAHDQLGVALELSGNINGVTRDAYQRAVTLDPEFALAYAHLGRLLRRNGKVNESGEAYRRAIQLATDVPTMIMVADVLQSQQRYNESEQLLRQALREDGKNPTALFLLGRALIARAAFDEAESVLKKSIHISPKSLVSYTLLGSLHSRRKDFKEAEDILKKALQVISENEKKLLAREFETVGDGFFASGKKKDAVRAYQQAIALDSEKSILNDKLARAQED